ncbi:MAG: SDR family oxidoreductase [Acidobacteria bacterium]|nr:SDR family oxidoreductase [Acidobacteriota bacterium]
MLDKERIEALFDLTDRVAIVTGGSRGIGQSIAQAFAAQGAAVVIASRKAEACDIAAAEINDAGGRALAVPCHVGDLDAVRALVAATTDEFGRIDIVVNNAANPLMQGVGEITETAWEKALATNLRGPVFLVQEALDYLVASGHGSVINVSSAGAHMFSTGHLLYPVAKAGLEAATRSMAGSLAVHNVRVNAMVPGTIDTAMVRAMPKTFQESAAKSSLIGRAAHPDELVGLALLLASDAGSFMTGHCYFCDGGMVAD